MIEAELPLFPLHAVLFPGGLLPLRIFEVRYTDMVGRCMRADSPFGVCLIEEGAETGAATACRVGTLARIVDWGRDPDGLLGIVVRGTHCFDIHGTRVQPDGLLVGRVRERPVEPFVEVPPHFLPLTALLRRILEEAVPERKADEVAYDDARWVGYRLAELLPLGLAQKQYLLEVDDAIQRLEALKPLVKSLTSR